MKAIVLFCLGVIAGLTVYHYAVFPQMIDHRADHLNLMRYSYADGGVVPIEDVKWVLYYLKHGNMK